MKQMGYVGGLSMLPSCLFIGCKSVDYTLKFLTDSQYDLINELSDFILPDTNKSPGAKSAKVVNFIDSYAFHCYDEVKKARLQNQLISLDDISNSRFEKPFSSLSTQQKHLYVSSLENERNTAYLENKKLILFGYFTSEIGISQARRYVAVPGKFDGDVVYENGDGAWGL